MIQLSQQLKYKKLLSKNLISKICIIVLIAILAGAMIPLLNVKATSTFQGTVEDCLDGSISGAGVVLADCY